MKFASKKAYISKNKISKKSEKEECMIEKFIDRLRLPSFVMFLTLSNILLKLYVKFIQKMLASRVIFIFHFISLFLN